MVAKLAALIVNHPILSFTIFYQIVANSISALPTPRDNSPLIYHWFFKTAQGLMGSIPRLLAIYKPELLASMTGQAPKTTIPPNPPLEEGTDTKERTK